MAGIMQAVLASYTVSVAGPTPGSIYFPTTSSRVTLDPGIVVGGTYQSPFTVEGWFYSGDTPGTDSGPVLLSTTTGSGTPAYARALTINVVSTTQIVVDSNGAAATTFNLAQTLVADAWYYVAVSRDTSGFMQIWLGKQGDASAAASTSGRFDCSVATAAWALDGISDCIGAFVPAGRYSADDNVSGLRVTNTNLYTTTDATIAMPTQTFGYVAGLRFLQSPTDLTDLSGNQTLTSVGSAAYSTSGPSIDIQPYYTFYEAIGSTVAISTTQYVGSTKIYAYSSTYDVPSYQPAVVAVNDVEIVNTENRGHTMVVLSPSGATVSINWYDTYIDPAQLTALANALNGVVNGNRVVLVTYDASAFNAACRNALTTGYGDTNNNEWLPTRFSQIFVGIKS
jgi:hypothetical protein